LTDTNTTNIQHTLLLLQELWKKLNELFVERQCHPVIAGEFFYGVAEGTQFNETSNVQWNLTGEEKIFLLSLALSWLNGMKTTSLCLFVFFQPN
jgi:hypothetical protein